ncbi:glycosyltransferase [Flavobacterium sp. GA093]|uniref:Glycosyltransferase n=1 Tax=Flavobacterium hydrocarbonoxydans TaxID=2683249 RepID=A0A6I4NJD7_9FLAO|nr:glycosyltransferase [Flavobacterium hydrocarbonoxydans]MWB94508.1 glycosyltransferase [Flavobacterium hydrocarbonoxydans]
MISVVIRSKNQEKALEFLLKNLKERYSNDIEEIIVIDNLSIDNSKKIADYYQAKFVTIKDFSYGGSANLAASSASNNIVVIFSAHSYPVSPDFFKVIQQKFDANKNLAGLRCLHSTNDYKNYIEGIDAKKDPNKSGLIFSGSAFNRKVWQKIPFDENVPTFEDKDWTLRVLKADYEIDFAPVVFNYDIKRTPAQEYFRFTRDVLGNYQIWHKEDALSSAFKGFIMALYRIITRSFVQIYYAFKRLFFMLRFKISKPQKFNY